MRNATVKDTHKNRTAKIKSIIIMLQLCNRKNANNFQNSCKTPHPEQNKTG